MKWLVVVLVLVNVGFALWRAGVENTSEVPSAPDASASAHVNRLLLLSEIDASELRSRGQSARGESTSEGGEEAATSAHGACLSIGPVAEGDEVERMRAWLVERGAKARLRVGERRELALYWVFFKPLDSREAARERVSELKSKGVEDIFTIGRGDMANAVSLGVYSRKTSLERRLAELRSLGYDPEVLPRYRQKKATWYDARFALGFDFPTDKFTLAFPGAQAVEASCDAIETGAPDQTQTAKAEVSADANPEAPTGAARKPTKPEAPAKSKEKPGPPKATEKQ